MQELLTTVTTSDSFWYLENVDLNELLCPIKAEKMEHSKKTHSFKKGDFIYLQNEPSDKIYFLDTGRVKIGNYSEDGKEIIKAILQPGEIFGIMGVLGEEKRADFAQAMDEVTVCERELTEFKSLMENDQEFALHVTKVIGRKLLKVERRLESLIFKDARSRIVDFLKDLARENGQRIGVEMLVKDFYTHQEVANLTGTSRQTVTTVLNDLRDKNMIYFDRKRLLIRDMDTIA